MSNLQILSTSIRQLDNLFNLKDLHIVAGNEKKHEPYLFVRLDTTKELIEEIQKEDPTTQPLKTLRGTQGGTYACEELVLAYAMWISPKFHLVVLRAFLAMHKGELQNSAQIAPLAVQDQDLLSLLVKSYHFLQQANELRNKVAPTYIASDIDLNIGGHYLYNLGIPLEQHLDHIKDYIHQSSERIMFVKGMLSLLEEPKQTARF
ncbi:KilA-N domain-containing protein [Glaesserella parasuis]|nr:KilA-N domain-containing protein [Glaesserella parasuis]MCT8551692.1 KilA-N domain-containing protein [Glaesserella parasuis]MCT8592277.1 KilA-N domain-containing protein [Glaesserella parasuis]MDE3998456.1 KilA-N domain-containing protein [Glaesserella parasuis]MDP0396116.1 KilA-N domain-containing protein [Glaesserella parasuis]